MIGKSQNSTRVGPALPVLYLAILGLMVLATVFPDWRLWGLNWWAYWPDFVLIGAIALAIAILFLITRASLLTDYPSTAELQRNHGIIFTVGLTAIWTLLFVLLRTRVHLLGDGYTLLSLLARDMPLVKPRELGESMIHIWVRNLFGGAGEKPALLSYQVVSIVSGSVAVLITSLAAARFFESSKERQLFSAGVLSSGFMLLFFGYVENYALFVVTLLAYTLIGISVCRGDLSRWWLLPLAIMPPLMHILGAALLPSLAIPLLAGRNSRERPNSLLPTVIAALIAAVGASAVFIRASSDLFVQFAILPLTSHRFTVGSYTLFAGAHVIDFVNLLLLLIPGLPLAFLFTRKLARAFGTRPEIQFLLILTISCLGTAFVIDPKIGMPRDWDLLSFAGVPLSVLVFYLLVGVVRSAYSRRTTVLAVFLGMLALFSRAAVATDSDASVSHFINYLNLDGVKGMTGWRVLSDYYANIGDTEKSEAIMNSLPTMYAHGKAMVRADSLLDAGNPVQAKPLLYQVLAANPIHHPAWFSLGNCYMDLRRLDSARICFEIADALNPYNPSYLNNLAGLYYYAREIDKAEELWEKSYAVNHNMLAAGNLVQIYRADGRHDRYVALVRQWAGQDSATVQLVRELANVQLKSRDTNVKATLRRLIDNYADTAWVAAFYQRYPNLR